MKNFLHSAMMYLWEGIHSVFHFCMWLVTDHNGKPSTSRLILWVWTGFCIWWINLEVSTHQAISINAVYLVIISLLGPAMSIVMKRASSKDFVEIIKAIAGNKADLIAAKAKNVLKKPKPGEEDGA